jgi:hypothetical protein
MNRVVASSVVAYIAIAARVRSDGAGGQNDLEREQAEVTSSGMNDRILCPVLAAMHRAGDLVSDAAGNVELEDMKNGLHLGLGIGESLASFQAHGINVYTNEQKGIEKHRSRCVPPGGAACWAARKTGLFNSSSQRWLNLYKMNGKQVLEHGISTGIRGGDTNMPPDALNCQGVYPCRKRFNQFIVPNIINGRFTVDSAMKVVCMARQFGDRTGEHAYADNKIKLFGIWSAESVPGPEWQMKGAMSAMVYAFGKLDSKGNRYMTKSDLEAIFMQGRYPTGWQKHAHGCLLYGCDVSALTRFRMDVGECPTAMKDEWWQGSGCKTATTNTCGRWKKCPAGQTCMTGVCRCNRDDDGRTMCFSGGSCKRQGADGYRFFGSGRSFMPADNPKAPGNGA